MSIRGTINRCVSNKYDRKDVNRLVRLCHRYAYSYLRMKRSAGNYFVIENENIEDLALDFIAELFQKEKDGSLVALQGYFKDKDLNTCTDADVKIELRKLVFTKVDDNLFRYYGEKDPSLRKIIRNLKLAVRERNCSHAVCYRDGFLIVDDDEPGNATIMPADFMQMRLCSRIQGEMQIPEIIIHVIDIIREQDSHRKRFPLVILASIIRESFVILHDETHPQNVRSAAESNLLKNDLDKYIDDTVERIKNDIGPRYINKGKLQPETIDHFFNAATDIVRDDFSEQENGFSQYDHIRKYDENLDYEQYRRKHRPVLEYLVKLIRKDLVNFFRKDWARF
jgi:hypothetical protein